jgi:hypothetical protein
MKPTRNNRYLHVVAGLSALLLAPLGAALAQPMQCITDDTKCDYDLLCAFKLELAEKKLIHETYLANAPRSKKGRAGKRQGVWYDGGLYNQALADAKKEDPAAKGEDLAQDAYDQFATKVAERVDAAAKNAECDELGVMPKPELRGNWSGMHTDRNDCFGYVDFGRGTSKDTYTPDTGKDKAQGCLELWDSDMGHEAVHKEMCLQRQRTSVKVPTTFGSLMEEDIAAYRYSVQAAAEALKTMQIRCTADANTDKFRKRADKLLDQIKRYKLKGGAQP